MFAFAARSRSVALLLAVVAVGLGASGCGQKKSAPGQAAESEVAASYDREAPADDGADLASDSGLAGETSGAASTPAAIVEPQEPSGAPDADNARKIIKRGELSIIVEQYQPARDQLEQRLKALNGYIQESRLAHQAGEPSAAYLTLRVPAKSFMELVVTARELGQVEREHLGSEDISATYADLVARLRNQERLEARLLKLLEDRTARLADVVQVETQLARVREQIERYESQRRTFDKLVALATLKLTLNVREKYTPERERGFGEKLGDTFSGSLDAIVGVGKGLVTLVVALTPWLPVIVLLVVLIVLARRKRRAIAGAITGAGSGRGKSGGDDSGESGADTQ